jgi:hypothetical protein
MPLKTWRTLVGRSEHARAQWSLRSAQIELDAASRGAEDAPWVVTSMALLSEGTDALEHHRVQHCWHFVNAARRQFVSAQSDADRSMCARVLLIEAEKLSPWRRKAVETVLKDTPPSAAALAEALSLRDDYYETRYHRIDMQREQLRTIVTMAAIALAVLVSVSATAATPIETLLPATPWHWRVLIVVLAFGVLGGSFSTARTITVKDLTTIVPELALSKWITWARTLLGASLGLAAYVFLQIGLVNLDVNKLATAGAVAFVGGFSEEMVLKFITRLGAGGAKSTTG